MIRWLALGALGAVAVTAQVDASEGWATLTIVAAGPGVSEFRTLGLDIGAFALAEGETEVFTKLRPGTYVVVQAPPREGRLTVECSGTDESVQVRLSRGDDVVCTYTLTP